MSLAVPLRGLDHPGPPRLCGAAVGEHRLTAAAHLQHHAARASAALLKHTYIDTKCICFVKHDLAGYAVPVHADLPHREVIFQVMERDLFGDQGANGLDPRLCSRIRPSRLDRRRLGMRRIGVATGSWQAIVKPALIVIHVIHRLDCRTRKTSLVLALLESRGPKPRAMRSAGERCLASPRHAGERVRFARPLECRQKLGTERGGSLLSTRMRARCLLSCMRTCHGL